MGSVGRSEVRAWCGGASLAEAGEGEWTREEGLEAAREGASLDGGVVRGNVKAAAN